MTNGATIDSLAKAGRYLVELTAATSFEDAMRRLKERAHGRVANELEQLERYVQGSSTESGAPELSLLARFIKHVRREVAPGAGMAALEGSLTGARGLADAVRAGVPGNVAYAAALLGVALLLTVLWMTAIVPHFVDLYANFGAELPVFTQALLDAPWLVFLVILGLAAALVVLIVGTRKIATSVANMAPLETRWLTLVCGAHVRRAHDRWRVASVAGAWAAAGGSPVLALRDAITEMVARPEALTELTREVALADELGLAKHELDYQSRKSLGDYRVALERRWAVVFRVMQIAIAILVGAIVSAIYLPIFKMGAVI